MYAQSQLAIDELHFTYASIRRELLRFAKARTGDAAEAEDIVQDVWLRIEMREPHPVDNPRSYLFQMTNNMVIDRQRQQHRQNLRNQLWRDWATDFLSPELEMSAPDKDVEDHLIEQQEAVLLHDAIAQLPAGARRVLHLHKFDGHSHSDVAIQLGITRSAVEKHMAVAMKHLRKILDPV